ncbi:MAG: Smr/MutS family protein [Bacteroidales bacterium]|nr:Smr/MutS family protein [Bacteroidales bacterium]MCM1147253.1 Smr/MutS family protein [Bacteroidales bacterium]MCM1206314.1 Smr/MutS family protein [Bacillota bacterium]MCM1510491.1 Smr/MutS family protein [Clostridium sp.]
MIYPENFEHKIGFDEIRGMLVSRCMCGLGHKMVDDMLFSTDVSEIQEWLQQVREFRRLKEESDDFPLDYFFDMREEIARLRLEGTHLEEEELWNLQRSLTTIHKIITFLSRDADETSDGEYSYRYPALQRLTEGICIFPNITRRIGQILDSSGHLRDNATRELGRIRYELRSMDGSISRTLNGILNNAKNEGLIERDVTPALRDGRLVIPVVPAMKRKISGIVHDESASGRTVFIEPTEVVEANNKIRELEAEERREIVRILKDVASLIRPHIRMIGESYRLLAHVDFIRAKSLLAETLKAFEPDVENSTVVDWIQARHPLLQLSIEKHEAERVPEDSSPVKRIVPLDITLTEEKRLLIISGPNAGGKSVCLKTAGLLQYMLQCGLSIPVGERSRTGVFRSIMMDIGDEQSISDDLSTYSSHLMNMKQMLRSADSGTMILIDEFGTGTEPQIGGAIAESVLEQLCRNRVWGIVTTHYQNLKEFADNHEGVANGAMLYDRHEMRALFQLAIGRPGSSFAIEIARKIGLPESVIKAATEIVGQDYIQSDKYLQDIVRDKRYWEGKRQTIHQHEKDMEKTILQYREEIERLNKERREILAKAKAEAKEILKESNRRVELAIKEIRESQAEKEETKRIREELRNFEQEVDEIDLKAKDDAIQKKIEQIQQRQRRREERKRNKADGVLSAAEKKAAEVLREASRRVDDSKQVAVGDNVRIRGTKTVGQVESVLGKIATVVFPGGMRSKVKADRLEHARQEVPVQAVTDDNILRGGLSATAAALAAETAKVSHMTRETMDGHTRRFNHELDVRGMRGDEALMAVQYFIDDAILVGVQQVRILHGKGNGILRQLIRQYLGTVPNVIRYRDEDIRFGGTGITIAEF